jgi:hypothetical protein
MVVSSIAGAPAQWQSTSSSGVVTFPPVVVKPDQVSGENSAGYQSMLFMSYPVSMAPPYPGDVETFPQEAWTDSARPMLEAYPSFNELPEELQDLILASPTATGQLLKFFQAGGTFVTEVGHGNYQGEYNPNSHPPTIVLDKNSFDAAKDGNNDAHENRIWISTVTHELGHWIRDIGGYGDFSGGTLSAYKNLRANEEAMAVINSMVIGAEIEFFSDFDVTLVGYATDAQLASLYTTFLGSHDLDSLVSSIASLVLQNVSFNDAVTDYWNTYYGSGQ